MHPNDIAPRIALIGAMQEELSAVLALMPDASCETVAGRQFWQGHLHGHAVVAVLSGIGKVAAALTATVLIDKFQVHSIVFTGVAGGLAAQAKVGDVVKLQTPLGVQEIEVVQVTYPAPSANLA